MSKAWMMLLALVLWTAVVEAQAQKNVAPPPRSRAEVEAVMAKAP